jgi:hypothetical protein
MFRDCRFLLQNRSILVCHNNRAPFQIKNIVSVFADVDQPCQGRIKILGIVAIQIQLLIFSLTQCN